MRTAIAICALVLLAGCGFGEPSATTIGLDCGIETQVMGTDLNEAGADACWRRSRTGRAPSSSAA